MMSRPHPEAHIERVIHFFETLTQGDLHRVTELYAPHARFKDPFNDVRGAASIRGIFEHMFDNLGAPRFTVLRSIGSGVDVVLIWNFEFAVRHRTMAVHGASHLRFAPDGTIVEHRDYWDPAEEVYERVPVLGCLMRAIKRRLAAAAREPTVS